MAADYGPKFGELIRGLIDANRYNDYVLATIGRQHGLDVNLVPEEVWEEGHQLHQLFTAVLFDDMPSADTTPTRTRPDIPVTCERKMDANKLEAVLEEMIATSSDNLALLVKFSLAVGSPWYSRKDMTLAREESDDLHRLLKDAFMDRPEEG